MDHTLKHGQALAIVGPQASGKSTLARQIADQHGTSFEIEAWHLESYFGLWRPLCNNPDTLIVDGMPSGEVALKRVKTILTSDAIVCDRLHMEPRTVKTPHLIFCIDEEQLLAFSKQFRSFRVERVG